MFQAHLHGGVVNDHVVEFDVWVKLGNFFTRSEEKSVAQFHDIRFMYSSYLKYSIETLGGYFTCPTNEQLKW